MSGYRDRPWLGLYPPGQPADIMPSHEHALAIWQGGAGSAGAANRPFLFYFDTPLTGADVDADSDGLAVALAAHGVGRGDRVALFLQNVPQFVIAMLAAWKLGAIVVPVFNTAVRILDDAGEELPPGEVGEIATSGPMVVPGYWNKPDATERTLPGGELRTGDVGFMDSDGWFYLVDRKKDMIVASGYKVWPREVEDTLVLTAFCRAELAAYKYPRRIEILPDLPKTPTGKLLRRELRHRAIGD